MDLKCVVEVEEVLHLVVRDAAVDHRLLARVHDNERQLQKQNLKLVLMQPLNYYFIVTV